MKCPQCGGLVEKHTPVSGDGDAQPDVGDITICMACSAVLTFDEHMELVPIPDAFIAQLDEEQRQQLLAMKNQVLGCGYERTCQRMIEDYKKWRAVHPKTPVLISFRIPKGAFVIASLEDALKSGTLVVDYNGKRMLREMGWLEDKCTMPTLAQVKAVIELAHGCPISEDEKT
jgi:hypothetical protein